jgi:hypothetical protein
MLPGVIGVGSSRSQSPQTSQSEPRPDGEQKPGVIGAPRQDGAQKPIFSYGHPFALTVENRSKHPLCRIAAFPGTGAETAPFSDQNVVYPLDAKAASECIAPGGMKEVNMPVWSVLFDGAVYRQRLYETIGGHDTGTAGGKFDPSQPPGTAVHVAKDRVDGPFKLVIWDEGHPTNTQRTGPEAWVTTIEGLKRASSASTAALSTCLSSVAMPKGAPGASTALSGTWWCDISGPRIQNQATRAKLTFLPGSDRRKKDVSAYFPPDENVSWNIELHGNQGFYRSDADGTVVAFRTPEGKVMRVDYAVFWSDVGCQKTMWACTRTQ